MVKDQTDLKWTDFSFSTAYESHKIHYPRTLKSNKLKKDVCVVTESVRGSLKLA